MEMESVIGALLGENFPRFALICLASFGFTYANFLSKD